MGLHNTKRLSRVTVESQRCLFIFLYKIQKDIRRGKLLSAFFMHYLVNYLFIYSYSHFRNKVFSFWPAITTC